MPIDFLLQVWGSGKTFFVKQVKMILDGKTEQSYSEVEGKDQVLSTWDRISQNMQLKNHVPIYYDAWQNDSDDDPIYSLVYQMILDTENKKGIRDKISFSDLLTAAGNITSAVAGFDPNEIAESLKKTDFLETMRERKDIENRIKEYIDKLLPDGCDRLLIIIDELDRCNPEFAVKLLERIKHYFSNDKVTFVFSVNLAELQITIRNYYGNEFNASRYLDRFFDLRVTLPPPSMEKFYSLIGFNCNYSISDSLNEIMRVVFRKNHMQMRDCIKYLSLMQTINYDDIYLRSRNNDSRINTEMIIYKVIIPVIWGGMINNIFMYNSFMNENDCSLLTYFYNDPDTIKIAKRTLYYLFDTYEIEIEEEINMLHGKLRAFYNALMVSNEEIEIGQCLVTDRERRIFHQTVSLLSDNIMIN